MDNGTSMATKRRGMGGGYNLTIVSGGQTGVDRAALDAALDAGIAVAGWCPKGRRAEDGPIDSNYPLIETSTEDYAERTRANVRDSDGTLILTRGELLGGTRLAAEFADDLNRPCTTIHPESDEVGQVVRWIGDNSIRRLNVAGPRASEDQAIYEIAYDFIRRLLQAIVDE
jgi:hypothetical protein